MPRRFPRRSSRHRNRGTSQRSFARRRPAPEPVSTPIPRRLWRNQDAASVPLADADSVECPTSPPHPKRPPVSPQSTQPFSPRWPRARNSTHRNSAQGLHRAPRPAINSPAKFPIQTATAALPFGLRSTTGLPAAKLRIISGTSRSFPQSPPPSIFPARAEATPIDAHPLRRR